MSGSRSRLVVLGRGLVALVAFLVVGAGVVFGLWVAAKASLQSISTLDSDVTAAIIAATMAGMVSVMTVVYGQRRAKEREIAEAHRSKKVAIYGDYMELMFETLKRVKKGQKLSENPPPKLADFMFKFKRDLILWGSPGVIRAYLDWEQKASDTKNPMSGIRAWDKMLREFRKDLGNSNWLLGQGQLMGLILTKDAHDQLFKGGSPSA